MPATAAQSVQVSDFRGPQSRLEETDVPLGAAVSAMNVEYEPGQVRTRYGLQPLVATSDAVGSLSCWVRGEDVVTPDGLAYLIANPSSGKMRIVPSPAVSSYTEDLFTESWMASAAVAFSGSRAYMAPLSSDGSSAGQLRVTQTYGSVIQTDKLFGQASSAALNVATSATTGEITPGEHRFGFIMQTRTGGFGPFSPVESGSFQAVAYTAPGGKGVDWSITTTWPADISTVFVVMTTVANPNRWYMVPSEYGGSNGAPPSVEWSTGNTISISDTDLPVFGTDVTSWMNQWGRAEDDTGPFDPFNVCELGERMSYIATIGGIDTLIISEPSKHQVASQDQHTKVLPGFRQMRALASLRRVLYVFGPSWTYATTDTGDVPALWPDFELVDGRIGTTAPRGVCSTPSTGNIWVASTAGLYLFQGGQYSAKPVSYLVDDWWQRIDWSKAGEVKVVDHAAAQKVFVKAPLLASLDGSSAAGNYVLMFDYTRGLAFDEVFFSPLSSPIEIGDIDIGTNLSTKAQELIVGPSSAGPLLRQVTKGESGQWSDGDAGFDSSYRLGPMPGLDRGVGQLVRVQGVHFRIKGVGDVWPTLNTVDKVIQLKSIKLETAPRGEILRQQYALSEWASVGVATDSAPGSGFILSSVRLYFQPGPPRR